MRRARTALYFSVVRAGSDIEPCCEPTLVKDACSVARNRVTEETDLSNQVEIAALAETITDSKVADGAWSV